MNHFLLALLLFPFSHLRTGEHLFIGRFLYINGISRTFDRLVVSTPDGFFVYNTSIEDLEDSYYIRDGVKHAVLWLDRVYLITGKNHFIIYDAFSRNISEITILSDPRFIGTNGEYVAIKDGNKLKFFGYNGVPVNGLRDTSGFIWSGENVELSQEDPALTFLTPFSLYHRYIGTVKFKIFYPWMNLLYVGTQGNGIIIYDMNLKMPYDSIKIGFLKNNFRDMEVQDGKIWILGDNFVTQFESIKNFRNYFSRVTPYLDAEDLRDIILLKDKVLILSGENKILEYKKNGWYTHRIDIDDLEFGTYNKGNIFISTLNQLVIYDTTFNKKRVFDIAGIQAIEAFGDFLAILQGNRLLMLKNDSLFAFEDSLGMLSSIVYRISAASTNQLACIGTNSILIINKDLSYNSFSIPCSPIEISSISLDSSNIFIGTYNGKIWAYSFKDNIWKNYDLGKYPVKKILKWRGNILLILTEIGLLVLKV